MLFSAEEEDDSSEGDFGLDILFAGEVETSTPPTSLLRNGTQNDEIIDPADQLALVPWQGPGSPSSIHIDMEVFDSGALEAQEAQIGGNVDV